MKRGATLTRHNYPYVFAMLLVAGAFGELVFLIARAVDVAADSAGAVALGIAAHTLSASFAALTLALLYFDLALAPDRAPRAAEHPYVRDLDPPPDG